MGDGPIYKNKSKEHQDINSKQKDVQEKIIELLKSGPIEGKDETSVYSKLAEKAKININDVKTEIQEMSKDWAFFWREYTICFPDNRPSVTVCTIGSQLPLKKPKKEEKIIKPTNPHEGRHGPTTTSIGHGRIPFQGSTGEYPRGWMSKEEKIAIPKLARPPSINNGE